MRQTGFLGLCRGAVEFPGKALCLLAARRLRVQVPQRAAVVGFNDLTGSDPM